MTTKINNVIKYGESLIGIKYTGKNGGYNKGSFWVSDEKVPTNKIIKEQGCNCIGFIHLLRRKAGLPISVISKKSVIGTDDWIKYLKKNKRLKKFDYKKSYPKGTLLLRNYNPIDYGHAAVIYKEDKRGVLFSSIIHCTGICIKINGKNYFRGIKIDETVGFGYFIQYNSKNKQGKYEYICMPNDWLNKI